MPATPSDIERLYRGRYASYWRGVAALLGGAEGAHDVVQEAFAQALRDCRQFKGRGSLAGWVWAIALRVALKARWNGQADEVVEQLPESAEAPFSDRDPVLAEALRQLSPRRRLVIFLRYYADLSYSEIASLCGISEGTVAATLSQARIELLEALPKEGITSGR